MRVSVGSPGDDGLGLDDTESASVVTRPIARPMAPPATVAVAMPVVVAVVVAGAAGPAFVPPCFFTLVEVDGTVLLHARRWRGRVALSVDVSRQERTWPRRTPSA